MRQALRGVIRRGSSAIVKLERRLPFTTAQRAKFELLRTLVRRDLEARYKGSVFGNLWPLLNQFSQLLIYTYVFSIILRIKLPLDAQSNQAVLFEARGFDPDSTLLFGLWLFTALIPWIAFSTAVAQSANVVVGQVNLVKKVVFPLGLLPLVPVLSSFVESAFGLGILIVLLACITQNIPWQAAFLPLVWLMQILFTAGISYLVAGLTVFLRDVAQGVAIALNLWLYLTPVLYTADRLGPFEPWVMTLNPLASLTALYRDLVFWGSLETLQKYGIFLMATSLGVFFLGRGVYRKLTPAFADVL